MKTIFYMTNENLAELTMLVYRKIAIETLFGTLVDKKIPENDLEPIPMSEVITEYAHINLDIDKLITSVIGEENLKSGGNISYDLDYQTIVIESRE